MSNTTPIIDTIHDTGRTAVAFSPDGSLAYTGGHDTLVRIWQVAQGSDQDPPSAFDATEPITSLAISANSWLSASEDGEVRQYITGKNDMLGLVTSIVGTPIRDIAIDPKGKSVAVASDELSVRVVNLEDTSKITLLGGHTRGVRRVTWHPSGTFVTTSGGDGSVTVWDVSEDEPKLVEVVRGLIPAVNDSESEDFGHDCSAVWHPSGEYFLVATRAHDVAAVTRSNWSKSFTLSDEQQLGAVTALALSPNGIYLASASKSGVCIWSTQTKQILVRLDPSSDVIVNQLAWSPTENLLVWVDGNGAFVRYHDVIPKSFAHPVKLPSASKSAAEKSNDTGLDVAVDNLGMDIDLNGDDDNDLHDFLDDDIGGFLKEDGGEARFRSGQVEVVNITKAQPAFQPGATPMDPVKRKRLLAYNIVGYIEVTDQDTHSIVDVKMHDQSMDASRKGYHFNDNFKYEMAAMGERGVAFACQPEAGHRAHVAFKPYASWDTGSRPTEEEWTYDLPAGVTVLGLAVGGAPMPRGKRAWTRDLEGRGHVVIATSENEITFMTGTGMERYSMGLEGDFVSMVAGPEWVFVVHRDGATTIDGSQNLKGMLITLSDFCVLQDRRLPIPKNHTLKWIGVSEEGAPAMYDSTGVLYMMPRFRLPLRGTWARILDSKKLDRREGKDESYWPFAVTGETFRCLVLKGRQEHPPFPIPFPQEMEMRLPFRKVGTEEGDMEELFARRSLFLEIARDALGDELTTEDISKRETALDVELIKLLGKACSGNLERPTRQARALDITRLIHNPGIFASAIKVAQFYKLRGLEDRIQQVKAMREEDDRLYSARDKRREWASDLDAVAPPPRAATMNGVQVGGARPFEDFNPPAAVPRPGLTRANPAPVVEASSSTSPWDMDESTTESRRKRTPPDGDLMAGDPKRRALPSNKASGPKTNPFARKPPVAVNDPFIRDQVQKTTVRKSDSFFNKVEAAENGQTRMADKGKGKGKEVSRQTTLFGHGMRTSDTPKLKGLAARKQPTASPQPDETQEDTQIETQPMDEEDTQMSTDIVSGATTVLDNDDEEPMEWPDSPSQATSTLGPE